tara:strand:+ start:421 stop:663 length:243 start_codon:yes stop_codon:yes gene_type:complete
MEIDSMFLWNALLTLVIAPAVLVFRGLISEVKRLDILLSKTREEYATRVELGGSIDRVLEALHRLEDKLDRALNQRKIDE